MQLSFGDFIASTLSTAYPNGVRGLFSGIAFSLSNREKGDGEKWPGRESPCTPPGGRGVAFTLPIVYPLCTAAIPPRHNHKGY